MSSHCSSQAEELQPAEFFAAMGEILDDRANACARQARDDRRLAILMRDAHAVLTTGDISETTSADFLSPALRSVPDSA